MAIGECTNFEYPQFSPLVVLTLLFFIPFFRFHLFRFNILFDIGYFYDEHSCIDVWLKMANRKDLCLSEDQMSSSTVITVMSHTQECVSFYLGLCKETHYTWLKRCEQTITDQFSAKSKDHVKSLLLNFILKILCL